MIRQTKHIKLLFSAYLIMMINIALASFTGSGSNDDHLNSKFSLKNLNKLPKNYSLSSIKLSQFQLKGSQDLSQQRTDNVITIHSIIRLERGNTTFVYPYKYKVQVPKFKTPTPPSFH